MKTMPEIVSMYWERKKKRAPIFEAAAEVRDQYNGEIVVPLPELDEYEKPYVPNLLVTGIDQTAQRAGSTKPVALFAPLSPGQRRAEKDAKNRSLAISSFWGMSDYALGLRKRYRYLCAYASSPVLVRPDMDRRVPSYEIKDPLSSYPSEAAGGSMEPDDCIFSFYQPLSWIKKTYPSVAAGIYTREMAASRRPPDPSTSYQMLEYVDAEEHVVGCIGKVNYDMTALDGYDLYELERTPNRAGICPVVVPGRITLDKPQGQFDSLIGVFQAQARFFALALHGTERGIFPDEWVISHPGEEAQIIQKPNGRRGVYGKIAGGIVDKVQIDPSFQISPMVDRLERAQRLDGGIPAQWGGENPSNLRTARASEATLGQAVDTTIQELQEIMASSLRRENVRAIAIDKGYWSRPKSFYVDWRGSSARVDYNPADLWKTDEHVVAYSHPGSDINQLTVLLAQMQGTEMLSKHQARVKHPLVDDPDQVQAEVTSEGLLSALLSGIQQQAAQGMISPGDIARITQLVGEGKTLPEAVTAVHEEAQKRQATVDQAGASTGAPAGSPPTQPGLAQPGAGAEAGTEPVGPVAPSQNNLSMLLNRLHTTQAAATPSRGAA